MECSRTNCKPINAYTSISEYQPHQVQSGGDSSLGSDPVQPGHQPPCIKSCSQTCGCSQSLSCTCFDSFDPLAWCLLTLADLCNHLEALKVSSPKPHSRSIKSESLGEGPMALSIQAPRWFHCTDFSWLS